MSHDSAIPRTWLLAILAAGAIGTALPVRSFGEESGGDQAAAGAERPADAPPADRETEKQQRATAGLMALCGILIGGLGFLVLVMVWGARLRRMARTELPAQKTLQNDLWFLKPPKSPPE